MSSSSTSRKQMTDGDKTNHFYYSLSGEKNEDEQLLQPIIYSSQVPEKLITSQLIGAFNYWLKISNDKLQTIDEIVKMMCNSYILLDDIEDNSVLRRGIPVAHSIYGIASTIIAANYASFIALEKVINLQHPAASKIYMEQLLEFHRGQGMDIFYRDNFICPSEVDYKIMATRKTGAFFKLAEKLIKLFLTYEEDFTPLIDITTLYYQIRDDYCNLCSNEYSENKGYCEDLTEGKFSFPIIHALTTNLNNRQIKNNGQKDIKVKRHCIKLLENFGSFKYTRSVLEELDRKARAEINRLGGNPLFIKIFDTLKNWDTKEAPKESPTETF